MYKIYIYYLCTREFFIYLYMTYREIVYMCLDTLKITSDDSIFNEDHILFLINRYRSILLQQKYYFNTPTYICNKKYYTWNYITYANICIDCDILLHIQNAQKNNLFLCTLTGVIMLIYACIEKEQQPEREVERC